MASAALQAVGMALGDDQPVGGEQLPGPEAATEPCSAEREGASAMHTAPLASR